MLTLCLPGWEMHHRMRVSQRLRKWVRLQQRGDVCVGGASERAGTDFQVHTLSADFDHGDFVFGLNFTNGPAVQPATVSLYEIIGRDVIPAVAGF